MNRTSEQDVSRRRSILSSNLPSVIQHSERFLRHRSRFEELDDQIFQLVMMALTGPTLARSGT